MKLRVDRFISIGLGVKYESEFIDIDTDTPHKFILKVSYKNKKN
jgi:hypothetical protein